ncbi:MAG: hypothetical protein EA411_05195 [Saprospirales bacterium]|nr:MAG: hypothetical protein EA411_05195 [Saprospirales bacterium]
MGLREMFLDYYGDLVAALPAFTWALVIFSIFVFLGWMIARVAERRLSKRKQEAIIRVFFVNFIKWAFYLMGFIAAMDILGMGGLLGGIVAGASISAIIVGFAFKDIAENFVSGVILAFSSPFRTGDIIELNNFRGRVTRIHLRMTHIRTSDGRDVMLPNANILKNPLTNFTRDGFMRYQFTFGVDTPTDVGQVRSLIMDYFTNQAGVLKNPAPSVIVYELGDYSVGVRVAFWVDLFREKKKDRIELAEPILSRVINGVKELLVENAINMPGKIVELKNYDNLDPIAVKSVQ